MGEKILNVDDEESMPDLICNYSEKDTEHQDILFEKICIKKVHKIPVNTA